MIRTGMTWLAAALKENEGEGVTYRRGSTSASLSAWRGETSVEKEDPDGTVRERVDLVDWCFVAADMAVAGLAHPPRAGDRIEADAGTFEVYAPTGVPAWSYDDAYRQILRVHSRLVEEAAA
jgi:hypothetical protein